MPSFQIFLSSSSLPFATFSPSDLGHLFWVLHYNLSSRYVLWILPNDLSPVTLARLITGRVCCLTSSVTTSMKHEANPSVSLQLSVFTLPEDWVQPPRKYNDPYDSSNFSPALTFPTSSFLHVALSVGSFPRVHDHNFFSGRGTVMRRERR